MGQQPAASETWHSLNKPTSRDFYETMGQHTCHRNLSHPKTEPDHVKNSKSRFETDRKIPSENERKSSDFAPYGTAVNGISPAAAADSLAPIVKEVTKTLNAITRPDGTPAYGNKSPGFTRVALLRAGYGSRWR